MSTASIYGFLFLANCSTLQNDFATYKKIDCSTRGAAYYVKIWTGVDCSD